MMNQIILWKVFTAAKHKGHVAVAILYFSQTRKLVCAFSKVQK